ncbi:MAG: hypothetical protein CSA65_01410 [Proteobacteria bacterium]|nr:MAG: hypothetical protein CSA65_01410 [Pseudomonadota bacterium]
MSFETALTEHFDGAVEGETFVDRTLEVLQPLGFTQENTLPMVSFCRDEVCRPLVRKILRTWGETFEMSALAGMLFAGQTGFAAAHTHAPIEGGRERYLYIAGPHIGISEDGQTGKMKRFKRPGLSTACGALAAFLAEIESGHLDTELKHYDPEQSLIKARLLPKMGWGELPDLVRLTKLSHEVVREDLECLVGNTIDADKADYAIFTGIQVHGPDKDWIWPAPAYAMVNGERKDLPL